MHKESKRKHAYKFSWGTGAIRHATATMFNKKRQSKRMWIRHDENTKNKINSILPSFQDLVQDVTTLNTFNTDSDYQIVRAKRSFEMCSVRKKNKQNKITIIATEILWASYNENVQYLNKNLTSLDFYLFFEKFNPPLRSVSSNNCSKFEKCKILNQINFNLCLVS